jgi:hypothetical protein
MLRKVQLVAVAFFLLLPMAHADEASKRAKLDELFKAMKLDSLMQQMMAAGMKQGEQLAKTIVGDKEMSAGDRKILDAYEGKVSTLLQTTLAWDKLKPAYLDLYASTYSEEDVDGMLAFYRTPAGQHMVEKTPELAQASQKIVLGKMQGISVQLQDAMQEMMTQLKAAHSNDPAGK